MNTNQINNKKNSTLGVIATLSCYFLWGVLPAYWDLLSNVNAAYILVNRIIWSAVFMLAILALTGGLAEVRDAMKNKKLALTGFISGILISVNWGVYIYAVNSGHVLDASMGYFIEPVVVAAAGLLLFRERMNIYETITLCFAIAAILFLLFRSGVIPVLSLLLALSFALYGAVKKNMPLSAQASLLVETLMMMPFALAFAGYAEYHGFGAMGHLAGPSLLLLPLCGAITSIPLLLFNIGIRHIPYYLTGILMYFNPTMQFLMGLLYFHEELNSDRLIAFIIIWVGCSITLFDKIVHRKQKEQ